jgi:soluble lytic murein transglycosylase-like protein
MRLPSSPLLVLALVFAPAGLARAQGIYTYEEKDGTIIYTNVPPQGAKAKGARRLSGNFTPAQRPTSPVPPRPVSATEFDEMITAAAIRYRVPSELVRAIMHAESNFDATAVSQKGASGLMQLMPATAEDMYVKDIFEARDNIEGGTRYLRVLANQYNGDMVKMVAAYNAGPKAVEKYGGVPPYPETQAYVRKVIALYFKYKEQARARADNK